MASTSVLRMLVRGCCSIEADCHILCVIKQEKDARQEPLESSIVLRSGKVRPSGLIVKLTSTLHVSWLLRPLRPASPARLQRPSRPSNRDKQAYLTRALDTASL